MHLYLRDVPQRTLILTTSSDDEIRAGRPRRALAFRAAEGAKASSQAIVEFLRKDDVDLNGVIRLTLHEVMGCLGLISVGGELFLAVVTSATVIGNLTPNKAIPEQVSKINEVAFFSLNTNTYDDLSLASDAPTSPTIGAYEMNDVYERDSLGQQMQTTQPVYEHPCSALSKIMSSGTFYYASNGRWDISTRLQARTKRQAMHEHSVFDPRFVWNEYIAGSLIDFRARLDQNERDELDTCHFIILAIQGYVGLYAIPLSAPPQAGGPTIGIIGMISRLSWKRAGTRYNTRGVDDDGNVANFVEQQGLQIGAQRIQITRPQAASQPAFDRHFAQLVEEYDSVHAINLLGTKENEAALTAAYTAHLKTLRAGGSSEVDMSNLDFHAVVRTMGHDTIPVTLRSLEGVKSGLANHGFTTVQSDTLITPQTGVFRTNCLDCLDRTNFVQDILSKLNLEFYLRNVHREWVSSALIWSNHRELWAENGDALSRIYAGTGALNTSFTRSGKRTFAGLLSDATKSVARSYINNFQDKGKQAAIDLLLPPSDKILPWLFPRADSTEPDLFVLGFQEIVPLTAQQIVQTDPEKKRMWESYIMDTLATRRDRKAEYVVLRSEQLVGTALIVLCKTELIGHIRNVEAATKKTGLRGMSGNKGAVGIRLDYYDSSFCFITAHLAAGHSNVEERNNDYRTIANGLSFLKGKTIGSHENVIWLADTNYRVDGPNDEVRYLAVNDQLHVLLESDQLRIAMANQAAFVGYEEAPVLFRPTYRYDLYSDEYDTSEKLRIPAWTDRILFRGTGLDVASYFRAELKQSDHRPVYAIFHATARVIDIAKKNALQAQLLASVTSTGLHESLDEKLAALTVKTGIARTPPPPPGPSGPPVPPRIPDRPSLWDGGGTSNGALDASTSTAQSTQKYKDPFDSDHDDSASSSDEELYRSSLAVPIEPTPISSSTVRAWPVMRPGSRPAVDVPRRVSDSMPGTDTLSSSTSFERVEIPNSLKEGGLDTASTNVEEEAPKPVSVSAVASMFEAKAKEATAPSKIHSLLSSRSASGLSRTAPPRPPPKPTSLASRPST
ncbi:inositol polyphosphate 5-phosphatase [Ceratobasidium sp. 370]|nr:inositol polyphosphate 5-phosphatase [Ceratobasidium sp. 370]